MENRFATPTVDASELGFLFEEPETRGGGDG
jgi:hypothetical protein